jgi:hypothetical protein
LEQEARGSIPFGRTIQTPARLVDERAHNGQHAQGEREEPLELPRFGGQVAAR